MIKALRRFVASVRTEDLPGLRQHLARGATAFGWLAMVAILLGGIASNMASQMRLERSVALTAIQFLILVPAMWVSRSPTRVKHPEMTLMAAVIALCVGMCGSGWANGDGVSDDLQFIWVVPVGVAAFTPWRPTFTFVLGLISLAATAVVHFYGISRLTVPFWKEAELIVIGTSLGVVANQLQRHLWRSIENGRRQMAALDRVAGLGRLTAGLAHEVKTPIAATMNSLDASRQLIDELARSIGHEEVTDDDLREIARELREATNNARQSVDRVGQIIRRVREHTHGMHATSSTEFRVVDRVKAIEALVGFQLQRVRGSIDLQGVDPEATVRGDIGKFDQVLVNLVVNAIEAGGTGDKGVRVTIATRFDPRSGLVVTVEDDGPGFSPEAREHLFQPMYTTKASGTGLGLAISRELAEGAFNGSLALVPSERGARFEFCCGTAVPAGAQSAYSPALSATG